MDAPPATDADSDHVQVATETASPISLAEGFAPMREPYIVSLVSGLRFVRSPFAILRFISFGVFDAFEAVMRSWPSSHVLQKVLELQPPVANLDSATSVMRECVIFGIAASGQHSLPRSVFTGRTTPSGSVRCSSDTDNLATQASTGYGVAAFQMRGRNNPEFSAGTSAIPFVGSVSGSRYSGSGIPKNSKPSKFATSQVLEKLVGWNRVMNYFGRGNLSDIHFVLSALGRPLTDSGRDLFIRTSTIYNH